MLLVNGARFDLGVAKSGIFLLELILSDFILFNSIPKFKSNTIHKKGWNTRFLQGANEATSEPAVVQMRHKLSDQSLMWPLMLMLSVCMHKTAG